MKTVNTVILLSLIIIAQCKMRDGSEVKATLLLPGASLLIEKDGSGADVSILNTSLFSLRPNTLLVPAETGDAYEKLLSKQTSYFASYPARKDREDLFVPGDQVSDKSNALLDYLSKLTVAAGMPDAPADIHVDNQKIIAQLKMEIRTDPVKYGFTASQASQIDDITDIPFEFIFDRVIAQNSGFASTIGGGISAFLFQVLSTVTGSTRAWGLAIITSLGVEPTFVAAFTYATLKQLYILHRYYSFTKGAKSFVLSRGQEWDQRKHKFDPTLIEIDENFKTRANRAWILGAISGALIKAGANRGMVEKTVRNLVTLSMDESSQQAIKKGPVADRPKTEEPVTKKKPRVKKGFFAAQFPKALASAKYAGNGLFRMYQVLMTPIQRIITSEDWGSFMRKFIKLPSGADQKFVTERLRDFQKNKMPFLSPHSIAFSGTDFVVTKSLMFGSIYFLSHLSGTILLDTHLSPGRSIELALVSNKAFNSDFVQGTRQLIYPLCLHLTFNGEYMNNPTPESRIRRRKQACLKLIAGLEGVNLETLNPNLFQMFQGETQAYLSNDKINEIIADAAKWPYSYRVTWLAMLRSIFGLDFVPPQFWTLQYRMLIAPQEKAVSLDHHPPASYFAINSAEVSGQILNVERLYYATELLSQDMMQQKFNLLVASGDMEGPEISANDDPRIGENTPDLVDGFLTYFFHRKLNIVKGLEEMVHLSENINHREPQGLSSDMSAAFQKIFLEEGLVLYNKSAVSRDWKRKLRTEVDQVMNHNQFNLGVRP